MAFFDDLGKVFSNAGQGAIQKTKDMADIAKLNSVLSEEEKKINNLYLQIGKTYVQLHQQDYEEAFSAFFQAYQESSKKMDDCRIRIKELKNITDCPGCGAELPGDAVFCSKCGYRMPPKPVAVPDGMTKCSSCGAVLNSNMKFCTKCGTPVIAAPAEPVAPPMPATRFASEPVVSDSPFVSDFSSQATQYVSEPVVQETPFVSDFTNLQPQFESAVQAEPDFAPVQTQLASEPVSSDTLPAAEPVSICPQCGSAVEADCAFCINCGTSVSTDATVSVTGNENAVSSVCPCCGAALEDDSLFCIECGTKVR